MVATSSSLSRSPSLSSFGTPNGAPVPPISYPPPAELNLLFPGVESDAKEERGGAAKKVAGRDGKMLLELADGTSFEGFSFGQDSNISGECVFTTGKF